MLLNNQWNAAVDFGAKMADGNPVLGASKTWRGILATLLVLPGVALIFGYTAEVGILIAIGTISGDLFSSFVKRRLGMVPSSKAPLLDQIPESLIPALMMMHIFDLSLSGILFLVFAFTVIDMIMTYFLYHWRVLRKSC
ncbi:MAG: CDP-archaeol synthase [Nitrosomonas ureae]